MVLVWVFFSSKKGKKNTLPGLEHGSEGSSQRRVHLWAIAMFAPCSHGTSVNEAKYIRACLGMSQLPVRSWRCHQ